MSGHGLLAYVVFSGRDVGVFYNWYVFISYCKIYPLRSCPRTAAALAISGLDFSSRVFKGYTSYEAAHSAWDGFTSTGHLPPDVAMSLGTRPYPTPPIPSATRVLSPPSTPQRVYASSTPMPHTPRSTHTPAASPSTPRTLASTPTRNAAALAIAREALRADQEDFWVVFTGTAPGVYQGR
jgi:hypothetical protein